MSRRTETATRSNGPRGTTLGFAVWSWAPFVALSPPAKLLWVALYTTPEARRCPVGLWQGGPAAMAEASSLALEVVTAALAELQAPTELAPQGLVEYDPATRVARLVVLPDRCERAASGDVVRSWWTRWRTLPSCPVRDRHLPLLQWLCEMDTRHVRDAWADTFGGLPQPIRLPARPSPTGGGGQGGRQGDTHRGTQGAAHPGTSSESGPLAEAYHPGAQGRGEGEGSYSSLGEIRSDHHSSREISHEEGPVADPLATRQALEAWERREAERRASTPLARGALDRFGPRSAVPDGLSVSSGRYR